MDWIKVEDRLPEKWQQVLIYEHGRISETFFIDAYSKIPTIWKTTPIKPYHNHPYPKEWDDITHWMPLPAPPEEE